MDNDWLDSVDEDRRQKFESAWLSGPPPGIAEYLPPAEDARFVGTLEELVHIDMEFRWKGAPDEGSRSLLPGVASYIERFPELNRPGILDRLLQGEFEFRHRYGERPSPDEFLGRFADWKGLSEDLKSSLEQIILRIGRDARPDRPGDRLGHYKLIAEHGRGGFGAVWRAEDSRLGRRIAIKRLSRQLSRSAESRRRFLNEARITARLEHPGIVPIYDISNQEEEAAYYAMKLVRGKTLAETIRDLYESPGDVKDEVRFRRLLSIFLQVCQTIRYCHDAGVLHRDLKPQNVIVGSFGESIVLDWGLASFVDEPAAGKLPQGDGDSSGPIAISPTRSLDSGKSGIKGTPAYMAPEQASGNASAIGVRTDVYGLGAMLCHILTGQPPVFPHANSNGLLEEVRKGAWTEPVAIRNSVPGPLNAICRKAMARDPEDRYDSVSALAQEVENYLADLPVTAFHENWRARSRRWIRRHPTLVACGVLAMVFAGIAALLGLFLWQKEREEQLLRIAEVRRQAERADAMAFAQLQAGRFDSAAGFWNQASEVLAGEPSLGDAYRQVVARRTRAQRIDDFYRLSKTAQERMFFDQLREAAIYSQAALDCVGALDHVDWWNNLPAADLSKAQLRDLRLHVYRQWGVLATMRLADQAENGFSMEWLTGTAAGKGDARDLPLVSAAMFAASQGNRFRAARALQIITELGAAMTGKGNGVNLVISEPLNGTDAAMLGSILDTHAPRDATGKNLIRPFLGMRDPEQVAASWLQDAIADAPEWNWLPIFIGTNELRNGRNEDAIRSFSHALGVEPGNWVAYMHRAMASLQAAETSNNRRDRQNALRNASRDLQRAHDLESGNPFLYWVDGLLAGRELEDGKFQRSIRAALLRHPAAMHTDGNHFAGVSALYLDLARTKVDKDLAAAGDPFNLLLLRGMLMIWKGEFEPAAADLKRAVELRPDHREARGLLGLASFHLTTDPAEKAVALETAAQACRSGSDIWLLHIFCIEQQLAAGSANTDLDAALLNCDRVAITDWQRAITSLVRARHLIANGEIDRAVEAFDTAIAADLAVDTGKLSQEVDERDAPELARRIRDHERRIGPRAGIAGLPETIERPALMNGDFELGLSFDWGNSAKIRDSSIWSNHDNCQSRAEISAIAPHSGRYSLKIVNPGPGDEGSGYGRMHQSFPATPGAKYRIRCWVRSEDLETEGLQIGIDDGEFHPVIRAGGTIENWTLFEGAFVANEAEVVLEIRSQGKGDVWLDDISIEVEKQ